MFCQQSSKTGSYIINEEMNPWWLKLSVLDRWSHVALCNTTSLYLILHQHSVFIDPRGEIESMHKRSNKNKVTCLMGWIIIIDFLHKLGICPVMQPKAWCAAGVVTVHPSVNSPLHCPPVCTVSSCVPCRWTSAGRTSANQSCRSGPVWQQLWSWCAHPDRPPATDTCLRREETSLQLLQREKIQHKCVIYQISKCVGWDENSFGAAWPFNLN